MTLEPRLNAYRPDLADIALRPLVTADRYVEPQMRQCWQGVLPLLAAPHKDAQQLSQIRYGEFLDVFEMRDDGFAWVQNRADRHVGYAPLGRPLGESIAKLSHRVHVLRTFVYPEPNMKVRASDILTLGSFVSIGEIKGAFVELLSGGFVFGGHITTAEEAYTPDYVFTAGRLLQTPYLWGGRTPEGIDCSALVQLALDLAGFDVLRDADLQRESFGQPLIGHWRDRNWRRGDVVFMKDAQLTPHVAIMTDSESLIHATAQSMSVTVEPLSSLIGRGYTVDATGRPEEGLAR